MRKMYHDLRFKEHLYIQKKKKKKTKGKDNYRVSQRGRVTVRLDCTTGDKVKHVEPKEVAPDHITNKQQSWV